MRLADLFADPNPRGQPGLIAALGFMLVRSLAASAGLAGRCFSGIVRRQELVGYALHRRLSGHLHATVHSELQGSTRHSDTLARPLSAFVTAVLFTIGKSLIGILVARRPVRPMARPAR